MLNGLEPIIIFQFAKLSPSIGAFLSKIPVLSSFSTLIEMPPIPLYLSEEATGIYIDSESKNVDISTQTETMSDGTPSSAEQRGIASTVTINLTARKDSLGLALLSAMIDLIFDKVTSKEYAISYLHGGTTIFQGHLHSYGVDQNNGNDLVSIKIELSNGDKQPVKKAVVGAVTGSTGALPGG
jgi:hypothetical protein